MEEVCKMQLIFDHFNTNLGKGQFPTLFHFGNQETQVFKLSNSKYDPENNNTDHGIVGRIAPIEYDNHPNEWDLQWEVGQDSDETSYQQVIEPNLTHHTEKHSPKSLRMQRLGLFGVSGGYTTEPHNTTKQKVPWYTHEDEYEYTQFINTDEDSPTVSSIDDSANWFYYLELEQRQDLPTHKVLIYKNNAAMRPRPRGILDYICETLLHDSWNVGYVSSSLIDVHRTFDINNNSILQVIKQIEEQFNCIILFDSTRNLIHCYTEQELQFHSNMVLTDFNFIQQLIKQHNNDEIVTRLHVTGENNTTLHGGNPTGQGYIDNFQVFENATHMSANLRQALSNYKSKLSSKRTEFMELLKDLEDARFELSIEQNKLEFKQAHLRIYEHMADAALARKGQVGMKKPKLDEETGKVARDEFGDPVYLQEIIKNYDGWREEKQLQYGKIDEHQNVVDTKQQVIDNILDNIQQLAHDLSYTNQDNFSDEELQELTTFIREGEHSFTTEDPQELYINGSNKLEELSKFKVEFSTQVANFINAMDSPAPELYFRIGSLVSLYNEELDVNDTTRLVRYTHSPDTHSLQLDFSNQRLTEDPFQFLTNLEQRAEETRRRLELERQQYLTYLLEKHTIVNYGDDLHVDDNKLNFDTGTDFVDEYKENEYSLDGHGQFSHTKFEPTHKMRILGDRILFARDDGGGYDWENPISSISARGIVGTDNYTINILESFDGAISKWRADVERVGGTWEICQGSLIITIPITEGESGYYFRQGFLHTPSGQRYMTPGNKTITSAQCRNGNWKYIISGENVRFLVTYGGNERQLWSRQLGDIDYDTQYNNYVKFTNPVNGLANKQRIALGSEYGFTLKTRASEQELWERAFYVNGDGVLQFDGDITANSITVETLREPTYTIRRELLQGSQNSQNSDFNGVFQIPVRRSFLGYYILNDRYYPPTRKESEGHNELLPKYTEPLYNDSNSEHPHEIIYYHKDDEWECHRTENTLVLTLRHQNGIKELETFDIVQEETTNERIVVKNPQNIRSIIDIDDQHGFSIQSKPTADDEPWQKQLYVDTHGNLRFTGLIVGSKMIIEDIEPDLQKNKGWIIFDTGGLTSLNRMKEADPDTGMEQNQVVHQGFQLTIDGKLKFYHHNTERGGLDYDTEGGGNEASNRLFLSTVDGEALKVEAGGDLSLEARGEEVEGQGTIWIARSDVIVDGMDEINPSFTLRRDATMKFEDLSTLLMEDGSVLTIQMGATLNVEEDAEIIGLYAQEVPDHTHVLLGNYEEGFLVSPAGGHYHTIGSRILKEE